MQLPGTFALLSSGSASELVKVHLKLLQGGPDNGVVRVQRDAELQIPAEGVKELDMPLDFLCAETSPPTPCPSGQTCDVGLCVDDRAAAPSDLSDYVATPPPACLDVLACFGGINGDSVHIPQPDELGRCSMTNSQVGNAGEVNVALVVNTSNVGNYGVCESSTGRCFVPLEYGPEGWQTLTDSNNQPTAIGLPDAVCRGVGTSIAGVAIVRTSTRCPPMSASASPCPATAVCVTPNGLDCPTNWSGFACSGGICPPDWFGTYCAGEPPAPGTLVKSRYCGEVGTVPGGATLPGLWCCGESDPAPVGDPLLIDDVSSGNFIKLKPPPGALAGFWFSASDDPNAISPRESPSLFRSRTIDPAAMPSDGITISHAACLRSDQGISGWYALAGLVFGALPDHSSAPLDLSGYTGISFWAYAPGTIADDAGAPNEPTEIRVGFPNVDTGSEVATTTCRVDKAICDDFGKNIPLTANWQLYQVRWDELSQQQDFEHEFFPSFKRTGVYGINFTFLSPGPDLRSPPFDFCVAQVKFTTN